MRLNWGLFTLIRISNACMPGTIGLIWLKCPGKVQEKIVHLFPESYSYTPNQSEMAPEKPMLNGCFTNFPVL